MIHVSNSQSMAYSPTNLVNFYDTCSQTYHTYPYKGPPQKILELQIHQPIFGYEMRGVSPYPGNLSPLLSLLKRTNQPTCSAAFVKYPGISVSTHFQEISYQVGPREPSLQVGGFFHSTDFRGEITPRETHLFLKAIFVGVPCPSIYSDRLETPT